MRLLQALSAMILCDFYKLAHREMYPDKTEMVYATWTMRASRMKGVDTGVWFGGQAFNKTWLIDFFNEYFFSQPEEKVVADYARTIKYTLGVANPSVQHIRDLHRLGYLPLSIKALPEGSVVPLRVPVMTIQNTDPRFFWLTNYVETLASCELWGPTTSATIAREYRKILNRAAMATVGNTDFVMFQGHDFSMRGMFGLFAAISSGMGHLLLFSGTDTVPSISAAEALYNANIEKELIGTSIAASEHSIQCSYKTDREYLRRLISEVHPSGFVSIVCDGRDFWEVLRTDIPFLKEMILARKGGPLGDKVVLRPDSGDPVLIVCGDPEAPEGSLEQKGAIQVLWDIFGGTVTEKGFKLLDSHIGLIYGDAITINRAKEITDRLAAKGFASINVVFGIGSYTYQYNTRDTLGMALKSTDIIVDGEEIQIFKDPKTDNGIKKSQKGRVAVFKDGDSFRFVDGLSVHDVIAGDQLVETFRDGKLLVDETFANIRTRALKGI